MAVKYYIYIFISFQVSSIFNLQQQHGEYSKTAFGVGLRRYNLAHWRTLSGV